MVVFYLYHEQVVLFGEKQTYRVSQKNGVLFTNLQQALVSANYFLALKNQKKNISVVIMPTNWLLKSIQLSEILYLPFNMKYKYCDLVFLYDKHLLTPFITQLTRHVP